MIFRLTHKLAKKLKIGAITTLPLDDNPYADWSCHLFTVDRRQYIIMCNTKSLYSTVMYGKGIINDSRFIKCALHTIREFMVDDGQAFVYERFVAPASRVVQFGRALNRSVTGSMNDLISHATAWLAADEVSPHDVGFQLNDVLLSALARHKKDFYRRPIEAFKMLADGY